MSRNRQIFLLSFLNYCFHGYSAKLFTLTDLFQSYGNSREKRSISLSPSSPSSSSDYSDYDYEEYLANTLDESNFVSNLKNNQSKAITAETLKRWTKIASSRRIESMQNDAAGYEHFSQEQRNKNYLEHVKRAKTLKMNMKQYTVKLSQELGESTMRSNEIDKM